MNTWVMVVLLIAVGYVLGRKVPQIGAYIGL